MSVRITLEEALELLAGGPGFDDPEFAIRAAERTPPAAGRVGDDGYWALSGAQRRRVVDVETAPHLL